MRFLKKLMSFYPLSAEIFGDGGSYPYLRHTYSTNLLGPFFILPYSSFIIKKLANLPEGRDVAEFGEEIVHAECTPTIHNKAIADGENGDTVKGSGFAGWFKAPCRAGLRACAFVTNPHFVTLLN